MNTDLHIVEIGQGEPIVFIHGSFDPAQETFSEQENLADEYRVVLVDRRGYGESPSAGSLDFDAQVDDILRVLGDGSSGGALIRSPAQQRFRIHWLVTPGAVARPVRCSQIRRVVRPASGTATTSQPRTPH